jgi:hypothetical protein
MDSILQVITQYVKKPVFAATLGAIAGLALGLIIGWGVWPVEWVDATPEVMREDLRVDYLRMAINSYAVTGDQEQAIGHWKALGTQAAPAFQSLQVEEPLTVNPEILLAYRNLIETRVGPISANAEPAEEPAEESTGLRTFLISIAIILILAVLIFLAFYLVRNVFRPRSGEVSAAMQAAELSRQTEKTNFQTLGLASPVTQVMTTYVLGDDLYDESFSIDAPDGNFLGEYGVGVSETIGVGDPKRVTALEVWLFDKNDIKTATKVLMSSHAFDDPETRARLQAKGDLELLNAQEKIVLDTETLQLLVTVVDLAYGEGPLPPESFFDRVTLELAVWSKEQE